MRTNNNALNSMLHVKKISQDEYNDVVDMLHETSQHTEYMVLMEEEQVSKTIDKYLNLFDMQALEALEVRVEQLQEEFINHLYNLLDEKNIQLREKIILSLSADNTLFLQCQEHEDELLEILGENKELHERLYILRKTAFFSHAVKYLKAANMKNHSPHLAQYKICVKGKLSHFYLTDC